MKTEGEFSVCQFFVDDSYEYTDRFVDIETAMKSANSLSHSVGAKIGTTKRVIITDGGDCVCLEWQYGKGLVYPTKEDIENAKKSNPSAQT